MSKLRAMVGLMIKQGYSEEEIQDVITRYKEEYPEEQVVNQPVPEYSSDEFSSDAIADIVKEQEEKEPPTVELPESIKKNIPPPQRPDTPEGYLDEIADETREISKKEKKDVNNMYESALGYYDKVRKTLGLPEDMSDEDVKKYLNDLNNKTDYYTRLDADEGLGGRIAKEYAAHRATFKKLTEAGLARGEKAKEPEDVSMMNTLKASHVQNKALEKYFEQNSNDKIAFDSLTDEEDIKDYKKKIFASEEYKQIEEQTKNEISGDEEKQQELDDFVKQQFEANKYQSKFEDRINSKLRRDRGRIFFREDKEERDLTDLAQKRYEKKQKETEDVLQKFNIVKEDLTKIDTELKDLAKYFEDTDIEKIIDDAKNKEYKNQEEIDAAQKEINDKIFEYRTKGSRYNFLSKEGNRYVKLSEKLFSKLEQSSLEEDELRVIAGEVGRNRGVVTTWLGNLGNAIIDLAQGIGDAADMVFQVPDEIIKLIDDPALEGYMSAAYRNSSPIGWVFGDKQETRTVGNKVVTTNESAWTKFGDRLDKWQELNITNKIRRPVSFDQIGGFGDAVEWGANLFAQQIPNLVLMAATG